MKFWDDVFNGGLDRDFDGDIDSHDRELWDMEMLNEQKREREAEIERQQQESWRDHYLDELNEYGIDADDYDDEDEFLEALEERRIQADLDEYFESSDNNQRTKEESISIPVKVQFSVEVKEPDSKKEPKKGILKYFTSYMDEENYARALIDNFPELAKDYGPSLTRGTLDTIIDETIEIDQDRAIKYVKWLWDNFTPDLFKNEEERYDRKRLSYLLRGDLIYHLLYHYSGSKTLYNLIKKDDTVFHAAFRDCVHPIHEISLVLEYMRFMLGHSDVGEIKRAYSGYLHWQKGRYTDNDLGRLWKSFVYSLKRSYDGIYEVAVSSEDKFTISDEIIPLIEQIGVRGKVPLLELQEYRETLKKEIEEDEEKERRAQYNWRYKVCKEDEKLANPYEYETEEEFQIALNKAKENEKDDRYAWRNTIRTYERQFADPNEYETEKEYHAGARKERKAREEIEWQKNEEEYLQRKNICEYCKVHIKFKGRPLYYLTGGLDLSVGDKVLVPWSDEECEGWVVALGKCFSSALPFEYKRIKPVLQKL